MNDFLLNYNKKSLTTYSIDFKVGLAMLSVNGFVLVNAGIFRLFKVLKRQ